MDGTPRLACVVVGYRNQPGLADAVRSLLAQDTPVEVVVVNSGGGGAPATLARSGIDVPVIDRQDRLFFGAAVNLGTAATSAPFVTYLEGDCVAEPGWVAGRLRRHDRGAVVVACAITNRHPRNPFAWAAHVLLWSTRMPGIDPRVASRHGLSVSREALVAAGGFRGDLRGASDTDLAMRLRAEHRIAWAPAVRTAHDNPRGPLALLTDQARRGSRTVASWADLGHPVAPRVVAWRAIRRFPRSIRLAWGAADPGDRRFLAFGIPFVPFGAFAYALGALLGRGRSRR